MSGATDALTDAAADRSGGAPLVSVIVPVYNGAEHIRDALEGLTHQSLRDLEIVVVDDGSADDSAAIAEEVAAADPRIRVHRQPENGGVARARERGVRESRGRFLWFVDADDDRDPRAAEVLAEAALRADADVVLAGARYVYEGDRERPISPPDLGDGAGGRAAFRQLLEGRITGHLWNKLFSRRVAQSIDFTPARVHSDLAMVAQMVALAERVVTVPDVVYSYLLRHGSIIRSGSRRAESLLVVEGAVEAAARGLDPRIVDTPEYAYFRVRFIVLSGMKDALLGPYESAERDRLVRALRSQLTWGAIGGLARRRDAKRLALAVTAKISRRAHLRLLRLAGERVSRGLSA